MTKKAHDVMDVLLDRCLDSAKKDDVENTRKWIDCIEYLYDCLDEDVAFFDDEEDVE